MKVMLVLKWLGGVLRSSLLTAPGKLVAAGMIALAYLVLHLMGYSEHVGVVMGTAHGREGVDLTGRYLTGLYMIVYLAWVLLCPILAISALLQAAANIGLSWFAIKSGPAAPEPEQP